MTQIKVSRGHTVFSILLAALSTLAVLGKTAIPGEEAVGALAGNNLFLLGLLIRLLARIISAFPDAGLLGLVVLVALLALYRHYFFLRTQGEMPHSKMFFALSMLFALFVLFGMSFQTFGSLTFLLQGGVQIVYALLLLVGLTAMFYVVCSFLLRALECKETSGPQSNRLAELLLDKYPILIPFCVLLLCWLPYWIACFPGSVAYDMNYQWSSFLGYIPMSGHHPVLSTLLYGYFLQFARIFFDDTICLALCSATQFVAMAACLTYGLHSMRRWGVSQNLRLFALLFFALNPLFPIWLQLLVKDCVYFAFFFAFTVALLDLLFALAHHQRIGKFLPWAMLWGILASLIRSNGIYITVPSLLLVMAGSKRKKQKVVIGVSALLTALIISLVNNGLMSLYGAAKGAMAEMLSIPFQQTARYVRQYGAELTQEERTVLNTVLDIDTLPQVYDPNISDPVKNARVPGYEDHLGQYLAIWAKMFFKHPVVYLEATLHNTYAYLDPIVDSPTAVMASISIDENPYRILDTQYVFPPSARNLCLNLLIGIKQLPAVGLLLRVGIYTWFLLFLAVLALYRKRYYLLLGCLPAAMNLLICIASPVNGYYRYVLPHIFITPVFIGWVFAQLYSPYKEEST